MKKLKTYQYFCVFIALILINLIGKAVASYFELPIWLDSVGTVMAGYLYGPVCGGIVGFTVNAMYGAIVKKAYFYAITNACVGIVVGISRKKGVFEKLFSAVSLSIILALVSTAISVPLNITFNSGYTGNLWGDATIDYFTELKAKKWVAYIAGELGVDILDKLISVLVVFAILKILAKCFEYDETRFEGKGEEKKDSEKNDINSITAGIVAFVVLAGSLILPSGRVYAKDEDETVDFNSYIQTIYSSDEGILGGEVNDIAQTLDGMLWVGTYGGLYQYDGNSFNFMSDFDSVRNVNCLYSDEEGRLWIGTNDSGLSICSNGEIVNVLDETGGLSANSVRSIVKSNDGLVFVGTSGALDIVMLSDGIKIKKVCEEMSYVHCLTADKTGYVCAVDSKGQLGLFYGMDMVEIYKDNGKGATFTGAYFDVNGDLLVATSDNIIEKYRVEDKEIIYEDEIDCTVLDTINCICEDANGIVFACADNGIGYTDGDRILKKIKSEGFDSSIDNMLIDYQGNYWFSSSRHGLLELRKSVFEEIYNNIGLSANVVNSVQRWNNQYYFATDAGVDCANEKLNNKVTDNVTRLFKDIRVRCLSVDTNGHMWAATSGKGAYEIVSESEWKQYTTSDGLADDKTRAVMECSDGRILVATDNGISEIINGKVVSNFDSSNGMITAKTLCLLEKDGVVYAGTDGGGIALISQGKIDGVISKADGLSSDIILRIVEDSQGLGLIVVTSNGLNYIDEHGVVKALDKFPYYNNFDIIPTEDGKLWVISSAGIYIVDEQKLLSGSDLDYEFLDSKKGLLQRPVANSWNYVDENDNLLLCCDKGVISVNMKAYDALKSSYRIMLESVIIDGAKVSVDKEEENIISADAVRVEFCPKVINYSVNDPCVSVWLEGFDKEPTIFLQSELENLTYTNLPSGSYSLHISILDNKRDKEIEKITYTFVMEEKFYDNWMFKIYLVLIFAIVVIYLVWLIIGSQINKSLQIQRKEIENLKLKQKAEAALEKGAAKDRFLALMSHDIRTPINSILGMNEMILRESKESAICEYAEDIKGAGNTLLSIVNTILDFSKIEDGKMEIVPVEYETRQFVVNLVNGIRGRAEDKKLEFRVKIDENLPSELYGDDVRLTRVMSNLLTNAVKYTEKGFVEFVLKKQETDGDTVSIYCEVRDSGIGIKEEDMGKLFEEFQRLDEKRNRNIEGTGLGMSIVTSLLEAMDSRLVVESEYGKGSVFSFVIKQKIIKEEPIGKFESAQGNAMEKRNKEEHLYAPNASILIVDDNMMNIKVLTKLLSINGINPDKAESGKEAIELVRKKYYDIIFMDHMMPEMDGIQTLDAIKTEKLLTFDTKVIILTANAINGAKEQYLKAGFDDYMTKPIQVKVLENKLKEYLPDSVLNAAKKTEE